MDLKSKLVTVVAVLCLSATAQARGAGKDRHGDDLGHMEKHFNIEKMHNLDLTEEQKEKLKELRKSQKDQKAGFRKEMKEAKVKFKEALRSNASREEVLKAYELMNAKKTEAGRVKLEGLLSAREILTAEQRTKLFGKDKD